jgi:hypothetical protein
VFSYFIVVDSHMLMSAAVHGTSAFADGFQQEQDEEARGNKRMRLSLAEGNADASTSL